MRLHSITLTNFRQFEGEQRFDLRSDAIRPVTLIFGANGSGKTTLLNAFTWALYGTFSGDVEHQERLVTDSVWRAAATGDSVEVGVEVVFDHDGSNYRVLRQAHLRKESDHQSAVRADPRLWVTGRDGSSEEVRAAGEKILTILPRGVSRFFFFNGERIENLVKKGAYSEVQHDIKVLLDLEQVDRALAHLPKVDRKLTQDIKKHGGDQASAIQTAIEELRDQDATLRDEVKILEGELAILTEEREAVTELLRQHDVSAPVQKQRDDTNRQLAEARSALEAARKERANIIATRGFVAFTEAVCDSASKTADSLYQKGALPAPLKREFVDKLLEDGTCICGTPLSSHSPEWNKVTEWRQRAGLQEVETAWQNLRSHIPLINDARREVRESLGQMSKRISNQRDLVTSLEEKLSELKGKLENNPQEDVQSLEAKRVDLDQRIGQKQRRVGVVTGDVQRVATEIDHKSREMANAEVEDELAAKARERSILVQNVKRALEEIRDIRAAEMRRRLDSELKTVFRSISHKNYIPTLSDNFELTLHKNVDGVQLPVAKSTGENQILSLSFVAAVSKLAREIRKERRAEGAYSEDSGTYPIVMDAAFGSLDHDYQEAVSRALAQMAPQLVVLVSKSQGLGKVVAELDPYISHLGIIESHTSGDDANEDDIELRGKAYPYLRPADADCSLLKEVTS